MPTLRAVLLQNYVAGLFTAKGMNAADAAQVAEVLVWADLRGVNSHGVMRVPLYLGWIDQGIINLDAKPEFRRDTPAARVLDADRAAGPVAMMLAADAAVEKARQAGIGGVLVARTTHTAALGFYARHLTVQGCVCIAFSASGPNMPYHGSRDAAVSTSPLCIGVPAGVGQALVLDMATSMVSIGKLLVARQTGEALAEGWAIDDDGRPTTDPRAATLPLPMAGAKGAGLALMAELITGQLTEDPILSEALSQASAPHRQNAMILAIDVAHFTDLARFGDGVRQVAGLIAAMPRQPGFDAILMPGERGDLAAEPNRRDGIRLPEQVWTDLLAIGTGLGLPSPP